MSKKIVKPATNGTQKYGALIRKATTFVDEHKNLVYIAIIGFCLSVTILYKLGQYLGLWA